MMRGKRGVAVLALVIFAVALTSAMYLTFKAASGPFGGSSGDLLSGSVVGIQTITGSCNVSIITNISNIGHDYVCQGSNGFSIDEDNVRLDCQNHTIRFEGIQNHTTGETIGIHISNRTGVIVENCIVYNFTRGLLVDARSSNNIFRNNQFYNNSNGINIDNGTANNFTGNIVMNSTFCGFNLSDANFASAADYNNIWNNRVENNSNNACASATDFSNWQLSPNCAQSNIIGGPCLGGNFWSDYTGFDSTGDGLGDTLVPHKGGGITTADPFGDIHPLVNPNGICPVVWSVSVTLTSNYTSNVSSGECFALTGNDMTLDCRGYALRGIGRNADDERGIEIQNQHNITIRNCLVYNFTYGIYIRSAQNITLENNTIYDNNLTGIYASLSEGVNITNNTIRSVGGGATAMNDSQDYGIWFQTAGLGSGRGNTIVGNTINNHSRYGIFLSDSSDYNSIYSNNVYNNTDGIFLNTSDAASIYNNEVHNNSRIGIRLVSSLNTADWGGSSSRNTMYGNEFGISLEDSTSDAAISGTIYRNTHGINLLRSTPDIRHTTIYNNSHSGILLNDSDNVAIDNSNISENSRNGLQAINVDNLTLSLNGDNHLFNNTRGVYLFNSTRGIFGDNVALLRIRNNTDHNLFLENSSQNIFNGTNIYGGIVGVNLSFSNNNTFVSSNISWVTGYNIYINISGNNTFYNNYVSNTTGGRDAVDHGNNTYNTSRQAGTNILGGSFLGGNFWSNYGGNDTTGDGIGDDAQNYSLGGTGNNLDFLPLATPHALCGNVSSSFTLLQNLSSNGSCMTIISDNVVLDFAGYWLVGNGSGIGINISNRSGVTVRNANIRNFTVAIYVDPSSRINVSNSNISESDTGILFHSTNHSFIAGNRLTNNTLGLNLTNSSNNTINNNLFNNTNNAQDDGSTGSSANRWNISYDCTAGNNSILGRQCSGGNYWSNYVGTDQGGGAFPYNTTNDGIGDTQIPYTNANRITGGDQLPLATDNGSVTLSCQSITSDTRLAGSLSCLSGDAITIAANGVTLDCAGNSVSGGGIGTGILIDGRSNIVVKNCNITNFYYGIRVQNSLNVDIIEGNDLRQNDFYGIYLYSTNNTVIAGNNIINDNNGVYSIRSRNTSIRNNTIDLQRKFYGIYLFNSEINNITNNSMHNNYHGIYLVNSSSTNITYNNISLSDVYSIFIHRDTLDSHVAHNFLHSGQEGFRVRQGSNSNVFTNNTLTDHTQYGLDATDVQSNSFYNNTFRNNSRNIYLSNASSFRFENNSVFGSATAFQALSGSNSLTFANNSVNATASPGVELNDSSSGTLSANLFFAVVSLARANSTTLNWGNNFTQNLNISNSHSLSMVDNYFTNLSFNVSSSSTLARNTLQQLLAYAFSSGNISRNTLENFNVTAMELRAVTSSAIHDNTIKNNSVGIFLRASSNDNNLTRNWLQNSRAGLNITSSSGNTVSDNYLENTVNLQDDTGNKWNGSYTCTSTNIIGGPCIGGNFYSTYAGLDNGASGREQGDGIGDQPANFTINAATGTYDHLPLVLYVARQYFAPNSGEAASMIAVANSSGNLTDEQIVTNLAQVINYTSNGRPYVTLTGLFNHTDVDAQTLQINFSTALNRTAANISGVSGINSDYILHVYHDRGLDNGVYLCPDIFDLGSATSTCTGRVNLTSLGTANGLTLQQSGDYYRVLNITNTSAVLVLNTPTNVCGSGILHNVNFSNTINCASAAGAAFNVNTDNITIDLRGNSLVGNGSGIGFNISGRQNVRIINGTVLNFTVGIYVDPSSSINLTRMNITNNTVGIEILNVNHSRFVSNRITNNTLGVNLTLAFNNTFYDNYFHNANNTNEQQYNNTWSNIWNRSLDCSAGPNILGEECLGGNAWHDYSGWDVDLDGVGETILPYNNSNLTVGDSLPLTAIGQIACGGAIQNLTLNATLNRSLTTAGTCFTIGIDNVSLNCQDFTLQGDRDSGDYGIQVLESARATIRNCVLDGFNNGLHLFSVNDSSITNVTARNNSLTGIFLNQSHNNTLWNNTIYNSSSNGITLAASGNNTLTANLVKNNSLRGIWLTGSLSSNNTIRRNNLTGNERGLDVDGVNNTIYNNYFNNSPTNAVANDSNLWNVTYNCSIGPNVLGDDCIGGNFWSDYNGSDNGSGTGGFNMTPWNVSGDGIGDTQIPYNETGNISFAGDFLPLIDVVSSSSSSSSDSSSSSSSTGGGGGGGGGGGSTVTVSGECTQSWQCGDWGECLEGQQSRSCRDANDCESKLRRNEVASVVSIPQPPESRTCAVPEEEVPEEFEVQAPPAEKQPAAVPVIPEPLPVKTIALSSLAAIAVLGGVAVYRQFASTPGRLRRKLRKLDPLLGEESSEVLKGGYAGVYNLYLKLSEKHKQNFYSRITRLRGQIEEQLKAEKKIEKLLEQEHEGDVKERRRRYLELYHYYQKLPRKAQEKFYPHIVQLREELEQGRKG